MTDRAEHLAWCKRRALEYLDAGELQNALTSMLSDMEKHADTKYPAAGILVPLGISIVLREDAAEMRRWIEGFR
jgi:hypothetical protein